MSTPIKPSFSKTEIEERIKCAERRLNEFKNLNGGDIARADSSIRLQIIQEFFFHIVGATEVLAQLINEKEGLNIDSEDVSISKVSKYLASTNPLKIKLQDLYINTRKSPFPTNPYNDEGYLYRVINYRNHVTHHHRSPINFKVEITNGIANNTVFGYLLLDPREPSKGVSSKTVQDDITEMYTLIKNRCEDVLKLL